MKTLREYEQLIGRLTARGEVHPDRAVPSADAVTRTRQFVADRGAAERRRTTAGWDATGRAA